MPAKKKKRSRHRLREGALSQRGLTPTRIAAPRRPRADKATPKGAPPWSTKTPAAVAITPHRVNNRDSKPHCSTAEREKQPRTGGCKKHEQNWTKLVGAFLPSRFVDEEEAHLPPALDFVRCLRCDATAASLWLLGAERLRDRKQYFTVLAAIAQPLLKPRGVVLLLLRTSSEELRRPINVEGKGCFCLTQRYTDSASSNRELYQMRPSPPRERTEPFCVIFPTSLLHPLANAERNNIFLYLWRGSLPAPSCLVLMPGSL